ncbi:MAG: poly-gamma-glutamate system protein [Candidatus Eisenbacteria bacterium]
MRRLLYSAAPWTKRADVLLVFLAILGLVFHVIAEETRRIAAQPHLMDKMAAATNSVRCFEAIRQHRMGTPAAMDRENDPEGSGLIGQEFTLTTTDRGILEAKLMSVNPNFAALFVEYFHELGLKPGDPVAIAMTGSFPALNIAVICAAEKMGLRPIPITSVGASMWGANDPEFTWLDIETLLRERGLIETKSVAASIGGSNDRGRGLSPKGRELLREAIDRNGIPLIHERTLDDAIARRIEIFEYEAKSRGVKAYVNVGGAAASIGTSLNGALIKSGVNRTLPSYNWTIRGALHHFARKRVPVIHILRIETLAERAGFPVSPDDIPSVGEGDIFHREVYDLRIVVPAFLTFLILCFGVLRARHTAAVRARESEAAKAERKERTGEKAVSEGSSN